jgi:hypothetical protein
MTFDPARKHQHPHLHGSDYPMITDTNTTTGDSWDKAIHEITDLRAARADPAVVVADCQAELRLAELAHDPPRILAARAAIGRANDAARLAQARLAELDGSRH